MSAVEKVTLLGEGGVPWTFELPLAEQYADQYVKGYLKPNDDDSRDALAYLLAPPAAEEAATPDKSIDEMTSKELDALAETLGLEGWDAKAKVDEKKAALHEATAE